MGGFFNTYVGLGFFFRLCVLRRATAGLMAGKNLTLGRMGCFSPTYFFFVLIINSFSLLPTSPCVNIHVLRVWVSREQRQGSFAS